MRDTLRVQSLERVDLQDFQAQADELSRANHGQLVDQALTNPARQRMWVLGGFAMTNPAAKQLQVARGRALLGTRVEGVVEYGLLASDGDLTKTVDLNAFAPAVYGVYIRFERVQGAQESRAFWDPALGGSEYSQAVDTRWTANWSVRVEAGSPGAEWLKIGEVDQATMAITDMRPFFFEGTVDSTFASGWSTDGGGVANDRSATRAAYGAGDLQMFGAAVRQCLEDIKGRGLRRWWDRDIGGMNVGFDAAPVEDELAVGDANFRMSRALAAQPRIYFDATDYLDFSRADNWFNVAIGGVVELEVEAGALGPGTAGKSIGMADSGLRWGTAYLDDLDLNQVDGHGVINDLKPAVSGVSDLGSTTRWWAQGYIAELLTNGDLIPGSDSNFDIGSNAVRWSTVYADALVSRTLNLQVGLGFGVVSDLVPSVDNAYDLGSVDRQFSELYLAGGEFFQYSPGAVGYKNWKVIAENSGILSWYGLDDAWGAPVTLMQLQRSLTPMQAKLFVYGGIDATYSSGYPGAWDPVGKFGGVNPLVLFHDDDPGVDVECTNWSLMLRQGTADDGYFVGTCWKSDFSSSWDWLEARSAGGIANQWYMSRLTLRALEIVLDQGTVAINGDTGAPTAAGADFGLTDINVLGSAGGGAFSIVGAVAAGPQTSTGFLKVYVAGVARWIPFFNTN